MTRGTPADTVFIRDLRVPTVVGIFDWERRIQQTVVLDLDMSADISRAARSDRIEDTLDYKAVAKRVTQFVSAAQYQLVETLAEEIAGLIIREFRVAHVKVTLHKPGAVSGSRSVGVSIERDAPSA
ncbi:MAG TPA: dihydroneopterin aldolase [Gammaproteobacteria bacterium]|nr:dihydroneopterin aldolase [Gammaproteobacteria bacterium]